MATIIGAPQRQILDDVTQGLLAGEPVTALVGVAGVGKTRLVGALADELAERGFNVERLDQPHPTPPALRDLIKARTDCHSGRRLLLVIDNAENVPAPTFKALDNAVTHIASGGPRLQLLLVGQPLLILRLRVGPMAAIGSARMVPLSRLSDEEALHFIDQRLLAAGRTRDQILKRPDLDRLLAAAQGLPAEIDAALPVYLERHEPPATPSEHARALAREAPSARSRARGLSVGVAAGIVLVAAGGYLLLRGAGAPRQVVADLPLAVSTPPAPAPKLPPAHLVTAAPPAPPRAPTAADLAQPSAPATPSAEHESTPPTRFVPPAPVVASMPLAPAQAPPTIFVRPHVAPPATQPAALEAPPPTRFLPPAPSAPTARETASATAAPPEPVAPPPPGSLAVASVAPVVGSAVMNALPADAPSRVVLVYPRRDPQAAARAADFSARLRAAGLTVDESEPDASTLAGMALRPGVSYFFARDAKNAVTVARQLAELQQGAAARGAGTIQRVSARTLPPPGTIAVAMVSP